jgi:hypothetical protein
MANRVRRIRQRNRKNNDLRRPRIARLWRNFWANFTRIGSTWTVFSKRKVGVSGCPLLGVQHRVRPGLRIWTPKLNWGGPRLTIGLQPRPGQGIWTPRLNCGGGGWPWPTDLGQVSWGVCLCGDLRHPDKCWGRNEPLSVSVAFVAPRIRHIANQPGWWVFHLWPVALIVCQWIIANAYK